MATVFTTHIDLRVAECSQRKTFAMDRRSTKTLLLYLTYSTATISFSLGVWGSQVHAQAYENDHALDPPATTVAEQRSLVGPEGGWTDAPASEDASLGRNVSDRQKAGPQRRTPANIANTSDVQSKSGLVHRSSALAENVNLSNVDVESLRHIAPADIGSQEPEPKPITEREVAPKKTAAGIILEDLAAKDATPGSEEATAVEAMESEMQATQVEAQRQAIASRDPSWLIYMSAAIGVGLLVLMLFRRPMKQMWMGRHLTRMTNIFDEIERTRRTMHIGAGGGFDSLSVSRQRRAEREFGAGVQYLRKFPRHEVTRELAKNALLAQRMGRSSRVTAIEKLIPALVEAGVALEPDVFMKSYSQA